MRVTHFINDRETTVLASVAKDLEMNLCCDNIAVSEVRHVHVLKINSSSVLM